MSGQDGWGNVSGKRSEQTPRAGRFLGAGKHKNAMGASGQSQNEFENPSCIVRYQRAAFIGPLVWFGIALVGWTMAMQKRGGWTVMCAGFATAIAVWFLLYASLYRTVFLADAVEQHVFPWFVRRMRYSDIRRVRLGGWQGASIFLSSTDGRQMRVYGAVDQLMSARKVLSAKIPNAFEKRT